MLFKFRPYPQEHVIRPFFRSINTKKFSLALIAIGADRLAVDDVAEAQIAGTIFGSHVYFFRSLLRLPFVEIQSARG